MNFFQSLMCSFQAVKSGPKNVRGGGGEEEVCLAVCSLGQANWGAVVLLAGRWTLAGAISKR
jgi:hypothetical protein